MRMFGVHKVLYQHMCSFEKMAKVTRVEGNIIHSFFNIYFLIKGLVQIYS